MHNLKNLGHGGDEKDKYISQNQKCCLQLVLMTPFAVVACRQRRNGWSCTNAVSSSLTEVGYFSLQSLHCFISCRNFGLGIPFLLFSNSCRRILGLRPCHEKARMGTRVRAYCQSTLHLLPY